MSLEKESFVLACQESGSGMSLSESALGYYSTVTGLPNGKDCMTESQVPNHLEM